MKIKATFILKNGTVRTRIFENTTVDAVGTAIVEVQSWFFLPGQSENSVELLSKSQVAEIIIEEVKEECLIQ